MSEAFKIIQKEVKLIQKIENQFNEIKSYVLQKYSEDIEVFKKYLSEVQFQKFDEKLAIVQKIEFDGTTKVTAALSVADISYMGQHFLEKYVLQLVHETIIKSDSKEELQKLELFLSSLEYREEYIEPREDNPVPPQYKDLKSDNKYSIKDYTSLLQKRMKTLKGSKKKVGTPKLKDIFPSQEIYEACLNVLKVLEKPVLNQANTYIGKSKGAWVLWFKYLERNDLIVPQPDKTYSQMLNDKGYKISDSTFRKPSPRAIEDYESEIDKLLSQVSRQRKLGKLN